MLKKLSLVTAVAAVAAVSLLIMPVLPATAAPLSGAIFTTDSSGVPVNLNIYPTKEAVYLNGGPGINAPDGAAGLPADTYSFQVTDPSGGTLLSSDAVECRQFTVDGSGVIQNVLASGVCAHATGSDGEDGGATVQLFPYADTPNNGGVYKVWVSPTSRLDCSAAGNKNCFVPRYSKTDNFKVRDSRIVEIDTRFWKAGYSQPLDGMLAIWTDTNGATNEKYSEYNPAVLAFHEAHVEAAEQGTHLIQVSDQANCAIARVVSPTGKISTATGGSVSIAVSVKNHSAGNATYFVDVYCR
ncbi:hypothetical protein E3T55_09465 [Cryobacterium frigoriphilum]|uniref:Uncharacterized protein n=1 Tax=Cryobacterium frigoriphilum TaxID=1259150 RepID=A0A4R9A1Y4_9MICO|nr:hypothetical protein [Cryobacterium frigoriphilum]TFD50617.1 hypothetical protein E3T55_09465 [Cryobacterium frigoriphilum]